MIKIDDRTLQENEAIKKATDDRATMKCVTKGCINWNGDKCTVPEQMSYFFTPLDNIDDYKNCPLKSTCRWYAQDQEKSCSICPLIKTKAFGR